MALRRRFAAGLLALGLAAGCGGDRTEILVVVDSDLNAPGELDQVQIVASRAGAEMASAEASLETEPLPRTLGLEHRGGPLGPIDLVALGRVAGTTVVQRGASVSFVPGHTRMLRILLLRSCMPTCTSLSDDALESWPGHAPTLEDDGGAPPPPTDGGPTEDARPPTDAPLPPDDAGPTPDGCQPTMETCNGIDDDCDGVIDDGFDFLTSPTHCGDCTTQCAMPDRNCCNGVCGRC